MALTADKILKHAGSVAPTPVHVPEWADEDGDDTVYVRSMTIREFEINQARLQRERDANDGQEKGTAAATLLARCVVDENGGRIFNDSQVEQIAELGLGPVMKLTEALQEVSGMGDDAKNDIAGESPAQTSNSSSE